MKTYPEPLNPFKKKIEIIEPEQKKVLLLECIYSPSHKADLLHRGTAYCRSCYDDKNRIGTLIN